jgi:hypothetical protein
MVGIAEVSVAESVEKRETGDPVEPRRGGRNADDLEHLVKTEPGEPNA